MITLTHKMALIEFQIHYIEKFAIFKYVVKISVTIIIFADIEEQAESMIKSGIV